MSKTIRVRGAGGAVWEVDEGNPVIVDQLERGELELVKGRGRKKTESGESKPADEPQGGEAAEESQEGVGGAEDGESEG